MTIRRFKPAVKIAVLLFLTAAATGAGYQLWRRCVPPPQSMPPAQALPVEPSGTSTETTEPEPSGSIRRENCYTFLLAASDQVSGNADVIMLATYDMAQQTLGIVSIPGTRSWNRAASPPSPSSTPSISKARSSSAPQCRTSPVSLSTTMSQ